MKKAKQDQEWEKKVYCHKCVEKGKRVLMKRVEFKHGREPYGQYDCPECGFTAMGS